MTRTAEMNKCREARKSLGSWSGSPAAFVSLHLPRGGDLIRPFAVPLFLPTPIGPPRPVGSIPRSWSPPASCAVFDILRYVPFRLRGQACELGPIDFSPDFRISLKTGGWTATPGQGAEAPGVKPGDFELTGRKADTSTKKGLQK